MLICSVKADKAQAQLLDKWKAKTIKDLKIRAKPLSRRAQLVYMPAHAVSYQYGEGFTTSGERRPYTFQVRSSIFTAMLWVQQL